MVAPKLRVSMNLALRADMAVTAARRVALEATMRAGNITVAKPTTVTPVVMEAMAPLILTEEGIPSTRRVTVDTVLQVAMEARASTNVNTTKVDMMPRPAMKDMAGGPGNTVEADTALQGAMREVMASTVVTGVAMVDMVEATSVAATNVPMDSMHVA